MEICLFGAGSLGSALGGILAERHQVTLVGRGAHMAAVRRHGLRLVGDRTETERVLATETVSGLEPPELLIICTKAYDTRRAVRSCRKLVGNDTVVLTLQNGLGNLEILRDWMGSKAFGGTTTMGAALIAPGTVRLSGLGKTVIGADIDPSGARRIAFAFSMCAIPVHVRRDIMTEIWAKAIVNACINPTAAILRVPNGKLLKNDSIARFMLEVSRECELVARASGVRLPRKHMYSRVRTTCEDTSKNMSSMLQDVLHGKRTEIAQINGAFCRIGLERGVLTPLNSTLVAMIESLDVTTKREKG